MIENEPPQLYDRNFAVAIAAQTFFVLANAMMAHYARFISHLGGDVQQIGWITGTGVVAGLLLRPWMGPWIDRLGARTTWAIGYCIYIAAALGNLLLFSLGPAIIVLRIGTEIGTALSFASALTYITHAAPPERRAEAIGTFGAGGFVGMLIGPAAGDAILGSGARDHSNFVWMFLTICLSVTIGTLMLGLLRKTPQYNANGQIRPSEFLATARRYWPGAILLVNMMFGICMTVPFVFLSQYADVLGIKGIGNFFFVYAGSGLALRVGLRQLPDRMGLRRVLIFGMSIMVLGLLSFTLVSAEKPTWLLLAAFLCGTAHSFIFHPMVALSLEKFPDEARGAGSVLALIAMDSGRFAGGPLLGSVAYYFGHKWMFVFGSAATLSTILFYYWSGRNQDAPATVDALAPSVPSDVAPANSSRIPSPCINGIGSCSD